MTKLDIISGLIRERKFDSFLEITTASEGVSGSLACRVSDTFVEEEVAQSDHLMRWDSFFRTPPHRDQTYDIIMLDGLHLCEYVAADIDLAISRLNSRGIIVIHDCLPPDIACASRSRRRGRWTGDTWKAVAAYFSISPYLCYTVDTDYGCAIIDTGARATTAIGVSRVSADDLSWDDYVSSRDSLLNVVTPESFRGQEMGDRLTSVGMLHGECDTDGLVLAVLSVGRRNMTVIECGSGNGKRTAAILSSGLVSRIYCVDTWDDTADERDFDQAFADDGRVIKVKSRLGDAVTSGVLPAYVDLVYLEYTGRESTCDMVRAFCNRCASLAGHCFTVDGVKDAVTSLYGRPDLVFSDTSWLVRRPKRKVCIVVPLYRSAMQEFERRSMERCRAVLGQSHDIKFVCPESLDTASAGIMTIGAIERFDDSFFTGTASYSRLCSDTCFYDRFADDYTHMLIYQLDGYVFHDDLFDRWLRYDYVGAPFCFRCDRCNLAGRPDKVGNGGVSLRNIVACRDVARLFSGNPHHEDTNVFCYSVNPHADSLVKPTCVEALKFSLETNARRGYGITRTVPSFCHKLHRRDPELFEELCDAAGGTEA